MAFMDKVRQKIKDTISKSVDNELKQPTLIDYLTKKSVRDEINSKYKGFRDAAKDAFKKLKGD